jgi:iron-sulfur cluster assembly protein CyaY
MPRAGQKSQSFQYLAPLFGRIKVRTPPFMDDQEFKNRAEESLQALYRRLTAASDEAEFEADFNSGALAIEFEEPPGKFVISPNAPVHQIWVSAHSKSYKLDWDAAANDFVLPSTGQTLTALIQDAIGKQLGEEVTL